MINLLTIPLQDDFETTLSGSWSGGTGTVSVNDTPAGTMPSGGYSYIVVNPGEANMQVAKIDGWDGTGKTFNVTSISVKKGTGVDYTAQTHAANSVVRFSNNFQFWYDLQQAINSKLDGTALGNFTITGSGIDATGSMTFSDDETAPVTLKELAEGNGADQYFAISENDTTVGHFEDKVTFGDGIKGTKVNPGANEQMDIDIDTTDTTVFVKTSSGASDENKVPVLDSDGKLSEFVDVASLTNQDRLAGEDLTQGDSLFVEEAVQKVPADNSNAHGQTQTNTNNNSDPLGVRIEALQNGYIKSVTKTASTVRTTAKVYSSTDVLLGTASFSGNIATFAIKIPIVQGQQYKIILEGSGNYQYTGTLSFPIIKTYLKYTAGLYGSLITGLSDITTENLVLPSLLEQNIGDVTANTRVAIRAIGSGVAASTLKLALAKVSSPSANIGIRIETDNAGSPSGTLVDANATAVVTPGSLTTSLADTTATLAGSITIPKGTKVRVVLFAGTYGSETVNGTNYFKVGYSTNHTATRFVKLFNTSYGAAQNTIFPYLSSSLFETSLLSKTDANYDYKLPDIPRIATDDCSIGELVKYDFQGITKALTGLTKDSAYYISNTPGALSTSAGTNKCKLGVAKHTNELLLSKKVTDYPITVGASPFTYTNNTGGPIQVKTTGGTVGDIKIRGITIATATSNIANVADGDSIVVTYSSTPTMVYSDI